jgi:predicted PurR-regulated permease PerM
MNCGAATVPSQPRSNRSTIMATRRNSNSSVRPYTLVAVVLIIAVLYAAQAVLIPLALAILFSFLLAPVVIRLQSLGLSRVPSVVVVTALSFVLIGVLGWFVAGQVVDLAEQLPRYKDNIREKAKSLRGLPGGFWGRASENIQEITEEFTTPSTQVDGAATQAALPVSEEIVPAQEPLPVEIAEKPPNPFETVSGALTPILGPLASAGIVIVFVFFILIQREDLRDRLIRLIGEGQLTVTTMALDEAATKVSRYLVALLIVNVTYGAAVAVGLLLIGVPNWLLWGVLAALWRFIPYVGPWIGASLPIIVSLVVFEGWSRPVMTISLFVVIELISNNVMEPLLYGSRTGLTPVAVLLAAVFWAWLWGGVGLVLATPLTVCLVVIGRHVRSLEFLSVMLGDEPSLAPEIRVYQRLLAMDQDAVFELAQTFLKERPLIEFYEQVLVPAMALAERDRHHGELELARSQFIETALRDVVENIGERTMRQEIADEKAAENLSASDQSTPAPTSTSCILCLPAHDEMDEIVAMMLTQVLQTEGFCAKSVSVSALAVEKMELVEDEKPYAVCISAMPPLAVMHSRYLCKRLASRFEKIRVYVGLWNVSDLSKAQDRIKTCGPSTVVATFSQMLAELRAMPMS